MFCCVFFIIFVMVVVEVGFCRYLRIVSCKGCESVWICLDVCNILIVDWFI